MSKAFKNIVVTFIIGCAIFVVGNLLQNGGFEFDSVTDFLTDFAFYQLYTFVLAFINTTFFNYMEGRQWKQYDTIKRIVLGIAGSTILTLAGIFALRFCVTVFYYDVPYEKFLENDSWSGYSFALWITLTIVSIFHIAYFYNKYQKNKIKEQKVIAGTASAKFDALKNQLDPHFLFNSLNVLTSLIEENPRNAQRFTTSLSKVYRYVLEQKNKDLVTVDEELDFARTYMSLLKMRFEDSIIFEIPDRASNPESRVVPLSLQLLLENAVKHNMVTSSKPLHIKIFEQNGMLVVENNLQPKQIVKKSSGVGLENIKQRYNLLSNRKVSINQQAKSFAVAIPMLTKQVSIMKAIEPKSKFDDRYVRARKRVEELKEFYYSLLSYFIVIPFLIFIWYRYTPHTIQWFWFPMLGWGLGLAFHAYKVYVNDGMLGSNWEKRQIEKYMREEEEQERWN
ncbi:2TM domain-containing protein [Psychroserpens sp.]|uniref:2TM domain-containing protein n=1 Tax=Psychroserpens sp. TaxID=2020870 RepID=UPI001B148B9F|nr:2TM domain-containing protein [Psychroserpens sp.]MBO6606992.1 2TM domain-containing protein [Psychroserpens sp.]MBO6630533.1 2TM domain-containing protein [Psychroserpens sp.]MBO6654138.1 2TM domain-containing protein [Psychroserpens sp.]MBO6682576.1 2TM domain-containing protein [Psychroserpens sp.]MBO6750764.1 2TM domain-containing protein [Psychroserpens sp.]